AAGGERGAVLLAGLHSDPPAGSEPRRLAGVPAGPTGPRLGCCPHQRDLPHRDPRNCSVPDAHSRRCDRRDRSKPPADRNHDCGSRAGHARVLRRCRCRHGHLLVWAAGQPHATATATENESGGPPVTATLPPGQSATANFPPAEITKFRTIAADALAQVRAGNQSGATARIKDLETAWDDDQPTLQ